MVAEMEAYYLDRLRVIEARGGFAAGATGVVGAHCAVERATPLR